MTKKVRDVIRLLEQDGWLLARQKGSHRQYRKEGNPHVITIAGKPGNDMPEGLLRSVAEKSGIKLG
jgi:predicted RNA binding protein YcfA (HicA-like mRNA interferase family)